MTFDKKQYMKQYYQRPEVKQYMKQYMKQYNQRPEVKQYKKQYYQRPEVKQYKKQYMKQYNQKSREAIFKNPDIAKGITIDGMQPFEWEVVGRERDNNQAIIQYANKESGVRQNQIIDLKTLKEKWEKVNER